MLASDHHFFTVDLEDWYQGLTSTNPQIYRWDEFESRVVPNTHRLLALLREFNVLATFFVLGKVADEHPALIEAIAADGHELAVHGYHHRFVFKLTPDTFKREIDAGRAALRRAVDCEPLGHRAPYFSLNGDTLWAFDVLHEMGFVYDSSTFPAQMGLYGFPESPRTPFAWPNGLIELPANTLSFFGRNWPFIGGFYTRLLPYAITERWLKRVVADGHTINYYVHPWEMDEAQQYRNVTARERVTHYHGRASLEQKLRRILSDYRFGRICDALPLQAATPQLESIG